MKLWEMDRQVGPIGLDLDHEKLHLVQMEGGGERARTLAVASIAYPADRGSTLGSPRTLKALIAKALKGRGFRGRRVVTAIPPDQVKLMVLNYQVARDETEPQVILRLAGERTQESLADCVVDYLPIRQEAEKNAETSALVSIAREEAVIGYLEVLRSAGLRVEALEVGPVAVCRLVTWLMGDSSRENVLVIHLGRQRSYLTVLCGQRLILYREIDFGEDQAIEQLAKSLDMSSPSAASVLREFGVFPDLDRGIGESELASAREIRQTVTEILQPSFHAVAEQVANALGYTALRTRGESIDLVYLLGGVTCWTGADLLLATLLSIPVRILDPLATVPAARDASVRDGTDSTTSLAVAAGLALRGMANGE